MVRDKTEYLINLLIEKGFDVCLNTNLTLLDDEAASFLERTIGHDNIVYSSIPSVVESKCDDITQVKGSYFKILQGLKICRNHRIKVGLNMSVSQINIEDIHYISCFLEDNPVDSFTLFPVIPPIYDREGAIHSNDAKNLKQVADMLVQIHKKFGIVVGSIRPLPKCVVGENPDYEIIRGSCCTTGNKRFAIDMSTGEVEACSQENHKYGNIYEDSIEECYQRMEKWHEGKFLAPICHSCEYFDSCGGMCLWSEPCGRC